MGNRKSRDESENRFVGRREEGKRRCTQEFGEEMQNVRDGSTR